MSHQKRPMGRPHLRWADSIQHDFKVAKLTSKNWMKKGRKSRRLEKFYKIFGGTGTKEKKGKKEKDTQRQLKKRGNSQGQL